MSSELDQYQYYLPESKIAKHPLEKRDSSKLLVYKDKTISHEQFSNALTNIPKGTTIFFNNTKVIAARLYFFRSSGAKIEVFLTEPIRPFSDFQKVFCAEETCTWKCIIGNLKKWKEGETLEINMGSIALTAFLENRSEGLVNFTWNSGIPFLEIIEKAGHVPLPPYLNREEEPEDKDRYQTVFSKLEGAVAAPTAGLHFTNEILSQMDQRGIIRNELTLHVSAGTFRPIKAENFQDHDMHNEKVIIKRKNIEGLLNSQGPIFAVGTTALRTLESIYWYGVALIENTDSEFRIAKDGPYIKTDPPSKYDALNAIIKKFENDNTEELHGETEIFIYPGYEFKIVDGLFTNFHMPGSTLILLVAAFIGQDWRRVYEEALQNNYRFLSYGDTSLLFRQKSFE